MKETYEDKKRKRGSTSPPPPPSTLPTVRHLLLKHTASLPTPSLGRIQETAEHMHVTACLEGQKEEVEVGEDCRSLQALKQAIVEALPTLCVEGFDVSVGGRALDDDEGVVSLEESTCLHVVPNRRGLGTLALREAGREVNEDGLLEFSRERDVALCTSYLDAGVPIDCRDTAGRIFSTRATSDVWRSRPSSSTVAALRLMRRILRAGHLFTARASTGNWRSRPSYSTEAALRLMRRMLMAAHLFTARATSDVWRSRPSYSTEAALRLMRRLLMAAHLFSTRAPTGIWRSRPSYSTEAALRSMRRIVMAGHLFTPRAAAVVWHWSPSCWTVVAQSMSKSSGQAGRTLKESWSFCRLFSGVTTLQLRARSDAGSANSLACY